MRFIVSCLLLGLSFGSVLTAEVPTDEEFLHVLVGNEILDIAADSDDVWIATNKGVNRYHRDTKQWSFLTIADGLVNNHVQCIDIERREGLLGQKPGARVWFGTESGLSMFHKETGEWRTFTTRDGILENDIRDISAYGDSVWMISPHGASVYDIEDGTWTSYTTFPGVRQAQLTCVYHDSHYTWIGTTDGLVRYNHRRKRSLDALTTQPKSESERKLLEQHGADIVYGRWEFFTNRLSEWISPAGGGRSSMNAAEQAKSPFPDTMIRSIAGNLKYVFIGTRTGLVRYDIKSPLRVSGEQDAYAALTRAARRRRNLSYTTRARVAGVERVEHTKSIRRVLWEELGWTFFQLTQNRLDQRAEISDDMVDIAVSRGEFWAATPRGLVKLDPEIGTYEWFNRDHGFAANRVNTVSVAKGQTWAGTPHGVMVRGLFGSDWVRLRMERALPSNYVTAVGADHKWVWFGTPGAASRFNPNTNRWQTYARDEGLAGEKVSGIEVVGNFVWFATNEGISRLDKHTEQIDHFGKATTLLTTDEITATLVDGRFVWIGSTDGLARYDKVQQEWHIFRDELPSPSVTALTADPYYLWVGTEAGLIRYRKDAEGESGWQVIGEARLPVDDDHSAIRSLAANESDVFIAGATGLSRWSIRNREWFRYSSEDGIPPGIRSLAADESGVWIGGRGKLAHLNVFTGEIRHFTDADVKGLSHVTVMDAIVADDHVWFGTDHGIYRYNRRTGFWWVFAPYQSRGETDILIDSNIQTIAHNNAYVHFGTPLGMSRYDKLTGNWINTTKDDGLPDSDVRAIGLDGNDIWIATPNGVGHYDYVADEWQTYTRRDGLPGEDALAVAVGAEAIWIGTTTGAARFDKQARTWQLFTLRDGLPDRVVQAIAVDGVNVWFGTPEGIAVMNSELGTWNWYTTANGLLSNDIRSFYVTEPYLFINTPAGSTVVDRDLGSFTTFSRTDGLAASYVKSLDTAERYFWFGTPGGLTLYDLVPDLPDATYGMDTGLPSNNIQAVCVDEPLVWVGTDSGLARYDREKDIWNVFRAVAKRGKETRDAGLLSHNIKSLATARNHLWVGTRSGLSRYDKVTGSWQHMPLSTEHVIRSLGNDGRFLWLGTLTGLVLYDTASERALTTKTEYAPVRDVAMDRKGNMWFLMPDRLVQMYRERLEDVWITVQGNSRLETVTGVTRTKLAESDLGILKATCMAMIDDQIWIGRERGIVVYEPKKHRNERIELPPELESTKITDMLFDGEFLWVGTRNGVFRHEPASASWTHLTQQDGLSSGHVSAVIVDQDMLWVATADSGVCCYNKATGEWQDYRFGDGPADNNIRAMCADEKYVWLGTFSGGVCRYDKSNGLWTTYKTADYRTTTME